MSARVRRLFEDGKTVLIGQHDIQQNQLRQLFLKEPCKILAVSKTDGLIAAVLSAKARFP